MKITLDSGTFFTIPKGSHYVIQNPQWDGDKPETQFYIEIETTKAVCVETKGKVTAKVIP